MGNYESKILFESIINAETLLLPLQNGDSYDFRVFSFGERGEYLNYNIIEEIVCCLKKIIVEDNIIFDSIVSPEPGGHTWGLLMAYQTKKNFYINRINPHKTENTFLRTTPYNSNYLKSVPVQDKNKVIILDDIISTGSTLSSLLLNLRQADTEVVAALAIYNKQTDSQMSRKLGVKVVSIIDEEKMKRYLQEYDK